MTGLYSTVLKDKLKARYESLVGDPALVSLYEELAISKVLLASVLKKFHTNLVGEETDDLTDTSWFHELFAVNKDGDEIVSAKFRAVLLVIENITKLYASISKIELQRSQILTVRDVMAIMTQIRHEMSTICGSCPCRAAVAERLAEIKVRATNEKKN